MKYVIAIILILLGVLLGIYVAINYEPPPLNAYGGYNYTTQTETYKIVNIPDSNGALVCSYPVERDIRNSDMRALDCENDQGIFVEE